MKCCKRALKALEAFKDLAVRLDGSPGPLRPLRVFKLLEGHVALERVFKSLEGFSKPLIALEAHNCHAAPQMVSKVLTIIMALTILKKRLHLKNLEEDIQL